MAAVHLALQLRSQDQRFNWKEPLVFSLAIAAASALVVVAGGIINGDGQYALRDAAAMFTPMFPLIAAGSLVGRGVGWAVQRLLDRI